MVDRRFQVDRHVPDAVQYYRAHGYDPRHSLTPKGQYDMLDPGVAVIQVRSGFILSMTATLLLGRQSDQFQSPAVLMVRLLDQSMATI